MEALKEKKINISQFILKDCVILSDSYNSTILSTRVARAQKVRAWGC